HGRTLVADRLRHVAELRRGEGVVGLSPVLGGSRRSRRGRGRALLLDPGGVGVLHGPREVLLRRRRGGERILSERIRAGGERRHVLAGQARRLVLRLLRELGRDEDRGRRLVEVGLGRRRRGDLVVAGRNGGPAVPTLARLLLTERPPGHLRSR